ncbi:MAG: hypothetical protein LBH19_14255 [Dysgonamonadaceae bacterium]|jgi:exo-1,4-beta-D-glucosaminidase|nr:hypothetical protein [Dysgonamonadaceae bacterium]
MKHFVSVMNYKKIILSTLFFSALTIYAQLTQPLTLCGSEPFTRVPDNAVVLYDGWQMRESAFCGNDGAQFSSNDFAPAGWYTTSVPVTALSVLVNHGIYPNPYIGMNAMQIPDASDEFNEKYGLKKYSHLPNEENPWAKPYWFRKNFDLPASYKGKQIWLNLDGINYRADVWINGKKAASAFPSPNEEGAGGEVLVGMFKRFRLEVSEFVKTGEQNTLAVCIYPLDHPGNPVHAQVDGFEGQLGPNGGDAEISRDLTMYCTVGWDWIPQVPDRNIGFWQHVWLNATEAVRVTDPAVFTDLDLPKLDKANLKVRFFAQNPTGKNQKVTFDITISPDKFNGQTVHVKKTLVIEKNTRTEVILDKNDFPQLTLVNPQLWYPVGYGEQPLYNITVRAFVGKNLSSEETRRFGVREFSSYLLESGGRAFEVNGVTVRMSGGAWVPDMMLTWDAQRYRDEVRLMAAGNATFARINGCGIIVPDVFLDECDERGLLVWQDLMRTTYSPDYRKDKNPGVGYFWHPTPADSTLYMDNMVDAVERLRGHAAFYLYCGSNEASPQENTGVALQNKVLPAMDGTRMFIASSHEQPGWANTKIGMTTGGPWDMKRLPEYWKMYRTDGGFTGRNEIGLTSPPTINTLLKSLPDYDRPDNNKHFPLNRDMGFHDATGWAVQSLDKIMREDIGNPSNITEYLWWSDLYNSAAYRAIFEAANSARPRNAGTMLWKTNAAWSSFNWQLYDWYLRPNAGFYSSRSALKPVHIQFDIDSLDVKLINALPIKLENYKVKIQIFSAEGTFMDEINKTVSAEMNGNATISRLPEMVNDGKLYFVALTLSDSKGRETDRNVQWYQKDMKWGDLTKIAPAAIEVDFVSLKTDGEEQVYTFNLKNMSSVPAVNMVLELVNGYQGMEILPSFWSDNALTLLPNECKEISVNVRKSSIKKAPHLIAEGLNVQPKEWIIRNNELRITSLDTPKVTDFNLVKKDGKRCLAFSVVSGDVAGERVTTHQSEVTINGEFFRRVIFGCIAGGKTSGLLDVNHLQAGKYNIKIGNLEKEIVVE